MSIRGCPGGDRPRRVAGRLSRRRIGAAVPGGNRRDDAGGRGRVDRLGQVVVLALDSSTQAQVDDVHSIVDRVLDSQRDVVAEGASILADESAAKAGEDVVVEQARTWRYAADRAQHRTVRIDNAEVGDTAGHRARDVRAVVEDDVLACAGASCRIGLMRNWPLNRVLAVEERMIVTNAGIDDADLDA